MRSAVLFAFLLLLQAIAVFAGGSTRRTASSSSSSSSSSKSSASSRPLSRSGSNRALATSPSSPTTKSRSTSPLAKNGATTAATSGGVCTRAGNRLGKRAFECATNKVIPPVPADIQQSYKNCYSDPAYYKDSEHDDDAAKTAKKAARAAVDKQLTELVEYIAELKTSKTRGEQGTAIVAFCAGVAAKKVTPAAVALIIGGSVKGFCDYLLKNFDTAINKVEQMKGQLEKCIK
ncbi:hypothetical protein GQ42DRAFT_158444 [Ramicandelaber brevisporus]|nr:hypothetical protein GQ42DRAFT_158444 [Ramicandelaber brevisporus]